ncbi:MAG: PepSY domain-containing protein [Gemmatimonadetes bacterium]|nr:PepSY domain-containing protein [Gemmatimonadota bacterium]
MASPALARGGGAAGAGGGERGADELLVRVGCGAGPAVLSGAGCRARGAAGPAGGRCAGAGAGDVRERGVPGGQRADAVEPGTGRVLAERAPGDVVINEAYRLHSALFLTGGGRTLVSGLAVVLVALLVSGVVLSWRRDGWEWLKPRWRAGQGWRDVHQSLGIWSGALLGVAAVTTVLLEVVPGGGDPGGPVAAAAAAPGMEPAGAALPLEALAERARAVRPGWRLVALSPIDAREGPLTAVLERGPSVGGRRLLYRVELDRGSGAVVREGAVGGSGGRALLVELHTGQVAGSLGRVVMAVAGLVPVVLWVSGVVLWVRRRGE